MYEMGYDSCLINLNIFHNGSNIANYNFTPVTGLPAGLREEESLIKYNFISIITGITGVYAYDISIKISFIRINII